MSDFSIAKQNKRKSGLRHSHSSGGSSIDYYAVNSGIRKWNPMFKVLFSIALLLVCLIADNPFVSAAVMVISAIVSVGFGKLPLDHYIGVLTIPLAFIILGSIAVAVDFSKNPVGDWHLYLGFAYIYATKHSLLNMFALMLKAFGAISAMFILTLSTPSFELFSVLRKMHCPLLLVELMHMIYRFIFILLEVESNMRIAAESRLGFCDFKTSCYTFGHIASNLFVVALRKANAYYDAMEARCYDGEFRFLED